MMEPSAKEIEDMLKLLDGFVDKEESRMKIQISDDLEAGEVKRTYHHGRCDINSPWDCGTAFDNQEEK